MKKGLAYFFLIAALSISGCGDSNNSSSMSLPQESVIASTTPISPAAKQAQVFFHASTTEKKVALTFDDGPDDKYTPRILDILKKEHIHATFFVIGQHAEKYPRIVQRIVDEGHAIGNHSWDHANLVKLTKENIQEEVTKADDAVSKAAGSAPTLFRAPYGAVNQDILAIAKATGHQTIGWSVDTLDWDGKSVQEILNNVHKETKPGAIILMHSAGGKHGHLEHGVEALPKLIFELEQEGYSFVPVSELLRL